MNKKVNVKDASTAWLWLMILPFANGFILRNRAKKVFEKSYQRIGLLCGIVSILSPIMAFAGLWIEMYILVKNNPDISLEEAFPVLIISFGIVLCIFLASYLCSIISAFIIKSKYAYRKGVLNYANKNHIIYKDFETAENEVAKFIAQNNDVLEENKND